MTAHGRIALEIKSYEDLLGGIGRQIFYRAPRLNVRELFGLEPPTATVAGIPCSLADVSLSGLAVLCEAEEAESLAVDSTVPVELRVAERVVEHADARIARIEPTVRGNKIGLQLLAGSLDLPALRARHADEAIRKQIEGLRRESLGPVDRRYRALCADVVEFIRKYRALLTSAVERDPRLTKDPGAMNQLLSFAQEHAWAELAQFITQGNAMIAEVEGDQELLAAMKRLTLSLVTPDVMGGAIWNRAYVKPFGYPGDFKMMHYVYDRADLGDTLDEKLLHRLGMRVSHFVSTRMMTTRAFITETLARTTPAPARIMSLASGSAEEVVTLLRAGQMVGPAEFTLIDQDERALTFSYERAYQALSRLGNGSTLRCLHASFTRLMKGSNLVADLKPQDLIYSIGLHDYLRPRRARLLLESLFEQLAPGGLLVVANLRALPQSCRWVTDMVLDWELLFRTEAEMLSLAEGLPAASVALSTDATGEVYFLSLRKPG